MKQANGNKVLALGIDAGEPALVQQLIDEGCLPALARLRAEGKWLRVISSADIGGGSVWASMMTGRDPGTHGFYTGWPWNAESMSVSRATVNGLVPFWQDLVRAGLRVGLIDVPYSPVADVREGFEIIGWGPRDVEMPLVCRPANIEDFLVKRFPPHPYQGFLDPINAGDSRMLEKVVAASIKGARLRGDLAEALISESDPQFAMIVFSETHFGGHHLFHHWEPNHPFYSQNEFPKSRPLEKGLREIYHEIDRQIGRLLDATDENTAVIVFSLHGMQPSGGVSVLLEPLLCEKGYAHLTNWKTQSWREPAVALLAFAKEHTPLPLKRLYYRTMPRSVAMAVARPTVLPVYDWTKTRAFSLPTEQHGWIRLNLKGREAEGIVPQEEYESLCGELEQLVLGLLSEAGEPLVRRVMRSASRVEDAMNLPIPDLIINWHEAALFSPLRIKDSRVESRTIGQKFTGQHGLEGFGIIRGPWPLDGCDTLLATDMGELFREVLIH